MFDYFIDLSVFDWIMIGFGFFVQLSSLFIVLFHIMLDGGSIDV